MDLAKISKIQFYFWSAATVITLVMVIILYFQNTIESWYFLIPVLCVALALMRRWQWKRLSKSKAEKEARESKKKS